MTLRYTFLRVESEANEECNDEYHCENMSRDRILYISRAGSWHLPDFSTWNGLSKIYHEKQLLAQRLLPDALGSNMEAHTSD